MVTTPVIRERIHVVPPFTGRRGSYLGALPDRATIYAGALREYLLVLSSWFHLWPRPARRSRYMRPSGLVTAVRPSPRRLRARGGSRDVVSLLPSRSLSSRTIGSPYAR